jgi:hypothetical protein
LARFENEADAFPEILHLKVIDMNHWPNWARRATMEKVACVVIALGIVMMLQPFALILFTWSFVTTLGGTLMFSIVSKFPE